MSERIFGTHPSVSRLQERIRRIYRRLFSIHEIEESQQLQWMYGASILFIFLTFSNWINSSQITVETAKSGRAICWPFFQSCSDWYFLHALPFGYSQTTFYMLLYVVLMWAVYTMWKKQWATAHAILLGLFAWEALVILVFSYQDAAPFAYYHLVLTGMLLFAGNKTFFLKLSFVVMYFLSATTKIDSTWILGTYFTSLKLGVPLFPGWSTALLTNLVMFMQMVGSWFLMSKRVVLQRTALLFFLTFHFYSGIFVLYTYPTVSLTNLVILFGPMYTQTPIPFGRKTMVGWTVILLLCTLQALGFYAPGDRRITLEGNKFGMYMFEANHQCVVTITSETETNAPLVNSTPSLQECGGMVCLTSVHSTREGKMMIREERHESASSWNRCYPYVWWSRLHTQCALHPAVKRIALRIDHSVNGGPFYRIVDSPDICMETYRTLGPNDWIVGPPQARIVGYPVQNFYRF